MSEQIGFIGLGNMGQPMAGSLLKAGYTLTVYNRTASKAEPLIAKERNWRANQARPFSLEVSW